MRGLLAAGILCAMVLSGSARAAEAEAAPDVAKTSGDVTAWDDSTKTFTIRGNDGKSKTFTWGELTKFHGAPGVGRRVRVRYQGEGSKIQVLSVRAVPEPAPGAEGQKKQKQQKTD